MEVVNNYATNTRFAYSDYKTAVADSGLDTWFNKDYENEGNVIYVISEFEGFTDKCINASFVYGEGTFSIAEEIMTGNVASDVTNSIQLKNTNNTREYTSASGQTYTLVDEITDEETRTFVMIAYDEYFGYISFENLSDEEIHDILDTVAPH